ncbi:hypothetical protein NPIL_271871 [Nephila pilipes]|uniref:Uncharacterized protein n=1 Tax=Nephila pilipes TaxID=299642 RepID=A0A8X6P4B6_NEPPI|nr:hypothetical protein NPIL_271871 [Nephila pilipes]
MPLREIRILNYHTFHHFATTIACNSRPSYAKEIQGVSLIKALHSEDVDCPEIGVRSGAGSISDYRATFISIDSCTTCLYYATFIMLQEPLELSPPRFQPSPLYCQLLTLFFVPRAALRTVSLNTLSATHRPHADLLHTSS